MKIYSKENITTLIWDDFKDGAYARDYLLPFITGNTQDYIKNAFCEIQVLAFQDKLFPLVLPDPKAKNNSYVCSPYAQYISYGKKEMEIEFPAKPLFRILSKLVLNVVGLLCKIGNFDQVVYVNNWLLSTNLYHEFDLEQIDNINNYLKKHFDDRAIVFRSVNDRLNLAFYEKLKTGGFLDLLSRQVYILDASNESYKTKIDYKRDVKHFKNLKNYEWTYSNSIKESEIDRIKFLYNDLYLKKYTPINPQFTNEFIKNALKTNILNFQVLRHDGKIVAVIGFFIRDGVMTNPFVGYDPTYPANAGLFRMIVLQAIKESERLKVIFNMSSGASKFKKTRGGEPSIEYNLVYVDHLKTINKLPWKFFKWLSHKVVIPIMKKHAL